MSEALLSHTDRHVGLQSLGGAAARGASLLNAPAITQAVVMAGGKGTRLHPYSALFPKPLMPLNDMPILELLLRQMKDAGVTDILLAVNHLSHLLEAFFQNGERLGMKIRYRHEDQPLGTAGALGAMLDDLDEHFLVTNGDLLTTLSLTEMMNDHHRSGAAVTIGVFQREVKIEFGLIEIDQRNRMMAYREKPTSRHFVSMGVYALSREAVREHLTHNEYLDMPNLIQRVQAAGGEINCYHEDCVWLDIGRPDDFALAQQMFAKERNQFLRA